MIIFPLVSGLERAVGDIFYKVKRNRLICFHCCRGGAVPYAPEFSDEVYRDELHPEDRVRCSHSIEEAREVLYSNTLKPSGSCWTERVCVPCDVVGVTNEGKSVCAEAAAC